MQKIEQSNSEYFLFGGMKDLLRLKHGPRKYFRIQILKG